MVRQGQSVFRVALAAFRVAVVLHGVAIVELAMAGGGYQTLSLCAFLIAVVFLFVEWRYRFSSTSVALFPLVFGMTAFAAVERSASPTPDASMGQAWLVVHIVLVFAGYAALALTAVAAVAYLIQE